MAYQRDRPASRGATKHEREIEQSELETLQEQVAVCNMLTQVHFSHTHHNHHVVGG